MATSGQRMERSAASVSPSRSEEHTSELQSRQYLVCRLLLEKKTKILPHVTQLAIVMKPSSIMTPRTSPPNYTHHITVIRSPLLDSMSSLLTLSLYSPKPPPL